MENMRSTMSTMLPPIDELLLRERTQIVNIAKLVSYKHNSLIPLYSVKIVHQLSLKSVWRFLLLSYLAKDKLVDIFLEAQEELSILSGYVEKLEKEEPEFIEPGMNICTSCVNSKKRMQCTKTIYLRPIK
jgi:hypothetical protein